MIALTRLNGASVTINAELIESIEASPNTVINLTTHNRYIVQETVDAVVEKVIEYQKRVNAERPAVYPTQGFKRA